MRHDIMQLQRLTNSKICSQQVRDPEEKMMCFQFESEVWELEVLCMYTINKARKEVKVRM